MPDSITAVLGVMIPIIAIVMGIGIGMLSLLLEYRKKRDMYAMHHKERMAAIEKGMEVPPLPPEFFQNGHRRPRTPADNLRRGLVLLLVGAAITLALYHTYNRSYLWGLVPAAIGVANLLTYWIESRKAPRE
jgi:Domain of unknown function (DUF6249)